MTKRRDLYIVATDRRDLYELLKKQFAGDPNVEVFLDRRKGERRATRMATPEERRRANRRQFEQAHLLKTLGVVLVSHEHQEAVRESQEAAAEAATTGKSRKPNRRDKGA